MSLLISLVLMTAFACIVRKPLGRHPIPFYLLAIIVAFVGIYFTLHPSPNSIFRAVVFAIQKGHLGFSLFALVMFVGVFENGSRIRAFLAPIRAELSIMAAILIVGHFVPYLANYLELLGTLLSLPFSIITSLVAAVIMLILLAILTVTSFGAVKRRMDSRTWKSVQGWAYAFFGLIYLHLVGYLLPPALHGSIGPAVNLIVYTVLFVGYLILRIKRASQERKAASDG